MSKKCDVVFQDMHQAFLYTGENTSLTTTQRSLNATTLQTFKLCRETFC